MSQPGEHDERARPLPRSRRTRADDAVPHFGDTQELHVPRHDRADEPGPAGADDRDGPGSRNDGDDLTPAGRAPRSRAGAAAVGKGAVRGAALVGRGGAGVGKSSYQMARRATQAQGAGETGLSRLIEVHAFNTAGDAAVTVGLAGTVFFAGTNSEARGHTLLFLVLTMLPFAVVAPLMGPLLDRVRHGRRWAIGASMATRAFLCWVLAQAVERDSLWLFPVAMSVLVTSRAYLVTRSAAAPRLLPSGMSLVTANGRLSLAGVIGTGIGGSIAAAATTLGGPAWSLRVGFVVFVGATILAVLLPARIDSSAGEKAAPLGGLDADDEMSTRGLSTRGLSTRGLAADVVLALRANVGLRWLSGFLTIFLAFLMRAHPFPGWEDRTTLLLALVVGAAGVGNVLGTVMASVLRIAPPRVIVLIVLLADAVAIVVAAAFFDLRTAILVGLVAGVSQQLGKLALDSVIQDTVSEHMRTSVFGRSEALLQLSWVVGGIVAVTIPNDATIGMVLAAAVLTAWATSVLIWRIRRDAPAVSRGRAGRRT